MGVYCLCSIWRLEQKHTLTLTHARTLYSVAADSVVNVIDTQIIIQILILLNILLRLNTILQYANETLSAAFFFLDKIKIFFFSMRTYSSDKYCRCGRFCRNGCSKSKNQNKIKNYTLRERENVWVRERGREVGREGEKKPFTVRFSTRSGLYRECTIKWWI